MWPSSLVRNMAAESPPTCGPQNDAKTWAWTPNRCRIMWMGPKSCPEYGLQIGAEVRPAIQYQNTTLKTNPKYGPGFDTEKTPTCSAKIRTAWGRTRYPTICGRAHILHSNYDTADTQHGPSLCSSKSGATCRDLADACVNECAMLFTNEQRGWRSVYVWPIICL